SIPMVDGIDIDLLLSGDEAAVDGDAGTVEIKGTKMISVVSSALLNGSGEVLLLQRPESARSFSGRKSLVAGKIESGENPEDAAPREIFEETQIRVERPDASLPPIYVREGETIWEVYPFLFKVADGDPTLNKENVGFEWVRPGEIKKDLSIVPQTFDVVERMLKKME
ncbi:MAG: NUDIX domain-containing protein, partial [Methanomassiliicoccaceae archaeon]|nr:NUDIX domain-containing protein [Methanomassiliicoccaceae archaeon]